MDFGRGWPKRFEMLQIEKKKKQTKETKKKQQQQQKKKKKKKKKTLDKTSLEFAHLKWNNDKICINIILITSVFGSFLSFFFLYISIMSWLRRVILALPVLFIYGLITLDFILFSFSFFSFM